MKNLFKIEAKRKSDNVIEVEYMGAISHDKAYLKWSSHKDVSSYQIVDIFFMNDTMDNFLRVTNNSKID